MSGFSSVNFPADEIENLISVLIPCLNEERYVGDCLRSVLDFQLPPGMAVQILVVDGGSTDGTIKILDEFAANYSQVKILANPKKIQAAAMNIGLAEANGIWILRLDAHTLYPTDYLLASYTTALRTGADNTGGLCITLPGGDNYQAKIVQALTTHKFGVGDSGFRTGAKEGNADTVPFGFFRRSIFARIGFFDERLVRAQDYEFNRRILASGGKIWLNPAIQSRYYNQRSLLPFYRKQLFREAPYNAYMWYLAPYAFAPRHAVTGVFALGILGGLAVSPFFPLLAKFYGGAIFFYLLLALLSAGQQARRYREPAHVLVLPLCFFCFHFFHGVGVLVGLARILTKTAPVQMKDSPWEGAPRGRINVQNSGKNPRH